MIDGLKTISRLGLTLHVIKTTLAATLSWWLASLLSGGSYPVFAPLAAVLVTQVSIVESIHRSLYRVSGVIVGVAIGGTVCLFWEIDTWTVLLAIGLGLSLSTALRLNPQIISQVGVSSLLVLDYGRMHGYALERILETIVGAFVAVIITMLISPPETFEAVKQKLLTSTEKLAELLCRLGNSPISEEELRRDLLLARDLVRQAEKNNAEAAVTVQNLYYKPFSGKERLGIAELASVLSRIEHITVQVRGIARSLVDLRQTAVDVASLTGVFEITAVCIALLGEATCSPSPEKKEKLAQVLEKARKQQHDYFSYLQQRSPFAAVPECGAVFTDLGRILDEIEDQAPYGELSDLAASQKIHMYTAE